MEISKEQKIKIEQAWKYCNVSKEPFKAIALYRQLQVGLINNTEVYLDLIIEEAKAWKICTTFNFLTESEGIDTFNALVLLFENTIKNQNLRPQPQQLFEIGHLQISFAKKYKEGIDKLIEFKNSQKLDPARILEIDGFLGYAKFMMGNKEEGIKILKETINSFEKIDLTASNFQGVSVDLIKYTGVLLRLASITENKMEARKIANKALIIAKENHLEARIQQAEKFLKTNE